MAKGMVRKITAFIEFEDGTAQISEHKLHHDSLFHPSEMRKWIKEQSEKPVKRITFLKRGLHKPTQPESDSKT